MFKPEAKKLCWNKKKTSMFKPEVKESCYEKVLIVKWGIMLKWHKWNKKKYSLLVFIILVIMTQNKTVHAK